MLDVMEFCLILTRKGRIFQHWLTEYLALIPKDDVVDEPCLSYPHRPAQYHRFAEAVLVCRPVEGLETLPIVELDVVELEVDARPGDFVPLCGNDGFCVLNALGLGERRFPGFLGGAEGGVQGDCDLPFFGCKVSISGR